MTPELAATVRKELPLIEATIRKVGAFQSLKFKQVNAAGMDTYDATFAHGRLEWAIAPLSADGKVVARGIQVLQ